jgi:predicted ATPase
VITGAPASGKTECFERLQSDRRFADFLFFDELARRLLAEEPRFRTDRRAFHLAIYRLQTARESEAGQRSFVTDRGTVDAFAFHPETVELVNTTLDNEYRRYTAVIQLGSAAGLGHEFYRTDDIRDESIEDALAIERAIRDVWSGHPGYRFVEVRADFEIKYSDLLSVILARAETH